MSSSTPEKAAPPPADRESTQVSRPEQDDGSAPNTPQESETKSKHIPPHSEHTDSEASNHSDDDNDTEEGEVDETAEPPSSAGASANPPLPAGPPPDDDGWDFHWDATHQAYYFYNRFTGQTTWDNPRVPPPSSSPATTTTNPHIPPEHPAPEPSSTPFEALLTSASLPPLPPTTLPAGGYNPAIHGSYDPEAWYAKNTAVAEEEAASAAQSAAELYAATGTFNRFTGRFQQQQQQQNPDDPDASGEGVERHTDDAKSRRQMNAYFDVDAAANRHDGRSLKAERSGIKPSKKELKRFKEKRRAKKEEKRRAWLKE